MPVYSPIQVLFRLLPAVIMAALTLYAWMHRRAIGVRPFLLWLMATGIGIMLLLIWDILFAVGVWLPVDPVPLLLTILSLVIAWGLSLHLRDTASRARDLAQQVQEQRAWAVFKERDRLARELHDSLGQVLGYINVQAQAVRELLARGQAAAADEQLAKLVEAAQDAHTDVREYIIDLKAGAQLQQGFVPALEQYLNRFGQAHNVQTSLAVPEQWTGDLLSPAAEAQLWWIVQEALANIRKHAGACQARVALEHQAGRVVLTVQDDGCGFDTSRSPGEQSLGLVIMRERAQEIDAELCVISQPGQGTQVIVRAPIHAS